MTSVRLPSRVVVVGLFASGLVLASFSLGATPTIENPPGIRPGAKVYVQTGRSARGTIPPTGQPANVGTEVVTRAMCSSDLSKVTMEDLKRWGDAALPTLQPDWKPNPHALVINAGRRARTPGVDVVFTQVGGSTPPAGAVAALDAAAAYIESQWSDPVTISINFSFVSLGSGVIGSTSSGYVSAQTYTNARAALVANMDADDAVQSWLPSGSTLPVRYDGTTGTVTNEDRVFETRSNFRALGGTTTGIAATMSFNIDFAFDFDPSDGMTAGTLCFQSVVVHEVGHAMGFTSGADFRTNDIEMLDLYRFQRSDGTGDYNPDTLDEFSTTARLVDNNVPNNDHNSDLISAEYRMSDGNPYQASHFFEQTPNIGIMDPALANGQTFYPDFYRAPDRAMFDAIGWDYVAPTDTAAPTPDPMTWVAPPTGTSTTAITMVATTASDALSPPVSYSFELTSGGPGGASSGWITLTAYTNSGLQPNTLYSYRVKARDSAPTPNETGYSSTVETSTRIQTPTGVTFGAVTSTSIELNASGTLTNLGAGSSGLYFDSTTPGGNGSLNVWVPTTSTTATGLTPNTLYTFRVKARNQLAVETGYSSTASMATPALTGDINLDNVRDATDVALFAGVILGTETNATYVTRSDLNGNGTANADDEQMFVTCLIQGCPP